MLKQAYIDDFTLPGVSRLETREIQLNDQRQTQKKSYRPYLQNSSALNLNISVEWQRLDGNATIIPTLRLASTNKQTQGMDAKTNVRQGLISPQYCV